MWSHVYFRCVYVDGGREQVVLCLWPGTGNGQNNIEQPYRSLPMSGGGVTCVTATCNAASEANELLVENVLVTGTERDGCQVRGKDGGRQRLSFSEREEGWRSATALALVITQLQLERHPCS